MIGIKLQNVTYFYETMGEKRCAIRDISLTIDEGDYVAVIGHTGSGKSTLLKHLSGILKPTSGSIYMGGVDIWKEELGFEKFRKDIGLVFQNPLYQLFEETVEKDIAFGLKNLSVNDEEICRRVVEICDIVGIKKDLLKRSPFELSGGEKRRVALAGVLVMRPKLLLLDEPVSGLDPVGRQEILRIIKKYNKDFKATVILITHGMEDIYLNANKILVLNSGSVFKYGDIKEIFKCVSELQKIGLDVPDISKIFLKLKDKGFAVPTDIYSVEEAVLAIKNILLKS